MREFRSVQDFVKQLSKDVQQSMRTDVASDVIDLAIEQAQEEIYDAYKPKLYNRRYSFTNRALWAFQMPSLFDEYQLAFFNIATPNPYLNGVDADNGFATTDKHLPTLIEMGHEDYVTQYGEHGYDNKDSTLNYYHPRPFASTTSAILSGNSDKSFKYSLEKSLKTKGYSFEK